MPAQEITLDVREMEPPEPYEVTTEALRNLQPGQFVRMISRRRPRLLYPWLAEHGFQDDTRQHGDAHYEIFIWAEDDAVSAATVADTT